MTSSPGKVPPAPRLEPASDIARTSLQTPLDRLKVALADRYAIDREIGRGGASYVYLANDLRTSRDVAIKVLRPELAVALGEGRFQREIGIAQQLHHPNVLPMLEFGSADDRLFFTMPFVRGETLRARIARERQMKVADAIDIARGVAAGLDYAHSLGVVHRDVKPANILLDRSRTLVADFGIAKAMIVASGDQLTPDSGIVVGTAEYMSPEQCEGNRTIDGRSDVYALGCVVYEMLAGEPPFTGPNAQAVIARHCYETPRSIHVIRPQLPAGVERAIERALAKVPADRFDTAGQFVEALTEGAEFRTDVFGFARLTRRNRRVVALTLGSAILSGAWWVAANTDPPLDPNRVVVFPLHDVSRGATGEGEGVASFIGYALDDTRPLKWREGWELLTAEQRQPGSRIDVREARRLSRRDGAGFFIEGSILRHTDSVTVVLRLHNADSDSLLRTVGRSGPASASLMHLGLDAIGELLVDLVAPGGRIDVSSLRERRTVAVANFVQGDREYRRMRFRSALAHYQSALRDDSAFTLAALRGSYAATWLSDFETAQSLARTAVAERRNIPSAQAMLARGLLAYLRGAADTAVFYVRSALRGDSLVHAGWTLLGEIYARLLPSHPNADSLSRDALARARRWDADFAPTLLLLEELALRDGDVKGADQLRLALRDAGADTTHALSRDIMHQCLRHGPSSIDWPAAVTHSENAVLSAAKILGGRAANVECAIAGFRAVIETRGSGLNSRWGAFLGLQSLNAAMQDYVAARAAFARPGTQDLPHAPIYLLLGSAGHDFEREALRVADSLAAHGYSRLRAPTLWAVGLWESRLRNVSRTEAISRRLQEIADSSRSRRDSLLASAINAMVPLTRGDTASTMALLRALRPSASRQGVAWEPWESLGAERMVLAELLLREHAYQEAFDVATLLDASEPVAYPLYLRRSLEVRLRSAQMLGDDVLADRLKRRIEGLIR